MPFPTRAMHHGELSTETASSRFPEGAAAGTLTTRLILW